MKIIKKGSQKMGINKNIQRWVNNGQDTSMNYLLPYNIVLIGFMGSGKSSVGRCISELLNRDWIDTDIKIEEETNTSISQIFEEKGEAYFRSLEKKAVREVSQKKNMIISCGGGVVLDKDNIYALKKTGKIILLETTADVIYERIKNDNNLPVLKGNKTRLFIRKKMKERESFYKAAADITINTTDKSIENICDELLTKLLEEKVIAKN